MEDESDIKVLRKNYGVFREKYDLPEFSKLNEVFDVEEIGSDESEFLLRKIRKIISERITGYLRFVETILNPSNAPMFFFKMIKKLESSDKAVLTNVSEKIGELEVECIKLDLNYDEKNEADFIRRVFVLFGEIKKELLGIIEKMGNGKDKKILSSGSYFG